MCADDSSSQLSPTITGITRDPARTLPELFALHVGSLAARDERDERSSRDDGDIWRDFAAKRLGNTGLLQRLQRRVLTAPHCELAFENAWKNGAWNVAQPVSFDMDERALRTTARGLHSRASRATAG